MKPPSQAVVDEALERVTRRLAEWGAERVILHGSVARGDYNATSDIDLIIIKETDARFVDRIVEALHVCHGAELPLNAEPLVYTRDEYREMLERRNPLVTEASQSGTTLHDGT